MFNTVTDGRLCKVKVWDTAGQERFAKFTSNFFRTWNCVYFCFQRYSEEQLEVAEEWARIYNENYGGQNKRAAFISIWADPDQGNQGEDMTSRAQQMA